MNFANMTKAQLIERCNWLEANQHRTAKAGLHHISSLYAGALVTATLTLQTGLTAMINKTSLTS